MRLAGPSTGLPSGLPQGSMIKLMLGEFGPVILEGQRVLRRRLLQNGVTLQYPDMDKVLQKEKDRGFNLVMIPNSNRFDSNCPKDICHASVDFFCEIDYIKRQYFH